MSSRSHLGGGVGGHWFDGLAAADDHLARQLEKLRLLDYVVEAHTGGHLSVVAEDGDVVVSHDGHAVTLKKATGLQTLEMYALLEGVGDSVELAGSEETDGSE